ncbi:MAG: hypothetical protein FJY85_20345 [Deltaproteobacteria bacterium]|nr:hypothetical protein [Deltaproteobacteria bacterium]
MTHSRRRTVPYGRGLSVLRMEASEVEGVIKGCIDAGVDAAWPGCDIWPEVKPDNVKMWVKTVREYGKKPSTALGRIR